MEDQPDDDSVTIVSMPGTAASVSDLANHDDLESESFFTATASENYARSDEISNLRQEIDELKGTIENLQTHIGTLFQKYNLLDNEVSKIKNDQPKASDNEMNALLMLKAFQNGSKTYDLPLIRKENVTVMLENWSFEYKMLDQDQTMPQPAQVSIKFGGNFKKASFILKGKSKKGKLLESASLQEFDPLSTAIVTFGKKFPQKKVELSVTLQY
ncbi:Oidioi.mRNA.OKI2018_I69.PAR.g10525.t1.cds [Oikopleura dioica]|uniref:Oidioi.mRNA.OKI2018_I69.PAR.g10525.t1.cds n=1 Tax=Oikopleura dioica TaxID=34765 RepID=A0ABN7RWR2_OIKDI|nr:Oidioi.mRNA.OKI2018_I69.PAR.g10525.t1.cds [Oikopleura dioica]